MKPLLALLAMLFVACAGPPKTHTQVPSLKYARGGISDAKDFNSKAMKSNSEIDEAIKQLLMASPE